MRLVIDRTLFAVESADEALGLVDLFSSLLGAHQHQFATDPPFLAGADNGPLDDWLGQRTEHERQAYVSLLVNGLLAFATGAVGITVSDSAVPRMWHLEGAIRFRIERRQHSDWPGRRLTLEDAALLLREPLHLVLENSRTDFAFLQMLAGPSSGPALQALANAAGKIHLHGAGSGEIQKLIEALKIGPASDTTWRRLFRTWILFDRDSDDTDARNASRSAVALATLCEAVVAAHGPGLSWIALGRREAESYVPDSALLGEALNQHDPFVRKVLAWRADPAWVGHAWSLDLKNGVAGDLRADLPEADRKALKAGSLTLAPEMLKVPFNALPDAEVALLSKGLGKRLGKALVRTPAPPWGADLPAEYDLGPVGQAPRVNLVQSLFDRI